MYTIEITDWNYPDNKLPSRRKLEFLDWNGQGWSFLARDTQGGPRVVDLHLLSLDVFKIKMRESALKRGIPASIQRVALIDPPVIGTKKDLEQLRSCKRELGLLQWEVSSATKNKLGWTKDDVAEAKRRIKRTGCPPSGLDEDLRILPVVERFLNPTPYVDVLNEVVVEGWLKDQELTREEVESAGADFIKWLGVNAYNEKVGPDDLVAKRNTVVSRVGLWPQILAMVGYVITFTDGNRLYVELVSERKPTAGEANKIKSLVGEPAHRTVSELEIRESMGKVIPRNKKRGEPANRKTFDEYRKQLKIVPPYTMEHKQQILAAVQKKHEKVRRSATNRMKKMWDKRRR